MSASVSAMGLKAITIIVSLPLLSVLLPSPTAGAAEVQVGGLVVNQVWTPSNVYLVTNDTTFSNVSILPGTQVYVTNNSTIHVPGLVRAFGTSNAPVVFAAAPGNTGGWQGFEFENSSPGSGFDWCIMEGANNSMFRLIGSTVLLRNTVFTNNSGSYGGAIYADLGDRELGITNCTFISNSAVNDGGAIWAKTGTGIVNVVGCTIEGNRANPSHQKRHTYGGAMAIQGNAHIIRTLFHNNRAHAYTIYASGGIYARGGALWASSGDVRIDGCEFSDCAVQMTAHSQTPDISYAQGGAVCLYSGSMSMRNTLLTGNWLSAQRNRTYRGSAVYVRQGDFHAQNCTFADNPSHSAIHNDSGTVSAINCILYLNYNHVTQISGSAVVEYSDVQGGYAGEGNIDYNPIFDSSYRIIPGSAAIDAGNPLPEYNDLFFPPSQGTARCDQGYTGGPSAGLWLDTQEPWPAEVFRVEMGTTVWWTDRDDVRLELAVTPSGPWYPYTGPSTLIGAKRFVMIDPIEPRQFFRLARYVP